MSDWSSDVCSSDLGGRGAAEFGPVAVADAEIGSNQRLETAAGGSLFDDVAQMRRRAAKSVIDGRNDEIAARRKMSIEGAMREARLGHQRPDAHCGDAFLTTPRPTAQDDLVPRRTLGPPRIPTPNTT